MTQSDAFDGLDGFRVEVDRAAARADIVLARPPLNVVSMPQRDQLAAAFAALDADEGVRVIVLRADGKHFSSGGDIPAFMTRAPEQLAVLAQQRRRARALPPAGDRGDPGLLLRRRLRALARLRLPHRERRAPCSACRSSASA